LATAQPFIFNAPAKVSANWFGENERVFATSVGLNANMLGSAIGCLMPSFFVNDDDQQDSDLSKIGIFNMLFWTSIFGSITLVLVYFAFKDKPMNPPSFS
jgi:hypothetical protein